MQYALSDAGHKRREFGRSCWYLHDGRTFGILRGCGHLTPNVYSHCARETGPRARELQRRLLGALRPWHPHRSGLPPSKQTFKTGAPPICLIERLLLFGGDDHCFYRPLKTQEDGLLLKQRKK
jgi:hypothetical protein